MSNVKILIVEDEGIVSKDLKNILKKLGYEVPSSASSGKEAIKKAEEDQPDVILMDIVLKGEMDGVETADKIRAQFNIPIIYLTAYADEKTFHRARITEPYGYVIKPFHEKELYTAIEMALYKHQMERKLKESQQWLHTTLKSIADAVITTDNEGFITFMNVTAQNMTGWKPEEAMGHELNKVCPMTHEEPNQTLFLTSKEGLKIAIEPSVAPIQNDQNNTIGTVLILKDVTERKKMERLKDEFISVVSHELRTPMTIIKGALYNLKSGISLANNNIDRLTKMINNLLDLSRLESGKTLQNRIPLQISPLIKEVIQGFETICHNKRILIEETLPPEYAIVYADQDMIYQTLNNLIDNALRFAKSKVVVKANAHKGTQRRFVQVSIIDDGPGIPAQACSTIFNKFEQLQRTAGQSGYKGTGLGLAICKEIIELHEGEIWLESIPDEGTQFHFTLPVTSNTHHKNIQSA